MSDSRGALEAVRRRELAEFLRTRRACLRPEDVNLRGLVFSGRRRARVCVAKRWPIWQA